MREWLELRGVEFVEYDVEQDAPGARPHAAADRRPAHGAGAGRGRRGRADRLAGPRLHRRREGADIVPRAYASTFAASCRASASARSSSAWPATTSLTGWVLNGDDGVEIHLEGADRRSRRSCAISSACRRRRRDHHRSTSSRRRSRARPLFTIRDSQTAQARRRPASRPICRSATTACASCSTRSDRRCALSVHQLHELRAALLDRARRCPTTGQNTTMRDWPLDADVRGRVPRPARSPVPRAAGRLPGVRPGLSPPDRRATSIVEQRREHTRARPIALLARRRSSPSRESAAITSRATRANAAAVERAARPEVSQGEAVRGDGRGISSGARDLAELSADAEALLTSTARPDRARAARASRCPASRPTTASSA